MRYTTSPDFEDVLQDTELMATKLITGKCFLHISIKTYCYQIIFGNQTVHLGV